MFIVWVIFHVIVCFALIIVVLMQSAKGEGLAGGTAFGGAVSTAVFGGRGAASFLSRATTVLAIVFFVNCGALALMSSSNRLVAADGTPATPAESSVTRQAQEERDRALEQMQRQQDASATDSAARQAGEQPLVPTPVDTTAPSGN